MKLRVSKTLIIAALFIWVTSVTTAFAEDLGASVSIDGRLVSFSRETGYPFVDEANRTQVPFRMALESFGCTVTWDSQLRTAVAEKNGVQVKVPIGQPYIYKNGQKIPIDTAAMVKDNRTYLPIRPVLEAFDAYVDWDGGSRRVVISTQSKLMRIHFIDVGQGDAAFIDFGEYEVLIDAGESSQGKKIVEYIKPFVEGSLDLVIATHTHADHIGGMESIFSAFQVGMVIHSGEEGNTATYQKYAKAAATEPDCQILEDEPMNISMGKGAYLQIIETGDGDANSNNNSVVALLKYADRRILFTGDMEEKTELNNLEQFSHADVLKAGHHGSNTSSSFGFLNRVTPNYVVISAGVNNSYGHPGKNAMERFFGVGAIPFGTFRSGTIIMRTDGSKYHFSTGIKLTLDDVGAKKLS